MPDVSLGGHPQVGSVLLTGPALSPSFPHTFLWWKVQPAAGSARPGGLGNAL